MSDFTRIKDLLNLVLEEVGSLERNSSSTTIPSLQDADELLLRWQTLHQTTRSRYERYLDGEEITFQYGEMFLYFCQDQFCWRKGQKSVQQTMVPINAMSWEIHSCCLCTLPPRFKIRILCQWKSTGVSTCVFEQIYFSREQQSYFQDLEFLQKVLPVENCFKQ